MRFDRSWHGLLSGLIAPIGGFLLYASMYVTAIRPQHELSYFINELFLGTRQYQAPVLSLSLLANLAIFFIFDHFGKHKAMRGVILATLLYGIAIVVLVI